VGGLADAEHLLRVAALFVAGIAAFLAAQRLLVPEGFGEKGHYRLGALADNRARKAVFAGHATCEECHTEVAEVKAKGSHARPACEACHGPLAAHAEDPAIKPVRPAGRALCLRCHAQLVGRPSAFPQVEAEAHAGQSACVECHVAHDPMAGLR
jgi:predicted CXXCH cytochrome family protein